MKEQSHKSEMRAALQGDFERMKARRQEVAEPARGPEPEPEPAVVTVSEPVAEEPQRGSWLDRLRDRH